MAIGERSQGKRRRRKEREEIGEIRGEFNGKSKSGKREMEKIGATNEAPSFHGRRYPPGHYFLQYFNVKPSGFLEPSYRFQQKESTGNRGGAAWGCGTRRRGGSFARSFSCDAIFERRAASLRRGGGSRAIAPPPLSVLLAP